MAILHITREDIKKHKGCKESMAAALAAFDLAYPGGVWHDDDWTAEKALAYCRKRPEWAFWLQKKGLMPMIEIHNDALKGVDLSGLKLWKPDFSGADLTGCKFVDAKIVKARYNDNTKFDKGINIEAFIRVEIPIEPEPVVEPEPVIEHEVRK